jgi:hypothetical protein
MWGYGYSWPGMPMMALGALLCLALIVGIVWLLISLLNSRKTPMAPYTARSQDSYQGYEQGYQPRQPVDQPQEARMEYEYRQPEDEQPQATYPQEMPGQR